MSRHGHEPHVALFSRVLSGEERLESVQQWMEGQAHLTEACAVRQDRGQGVISEASLREALRAAFPGKPPALVSRLVSCASSASSPHPQHRAAGAVDFIRALSPVSVLHLSPWLAHCLCTHEHQTHLLCRMTVGGLVSWC